MNSNSHFNPLSGKIKCPLAIAWIAFFVHFSYNSYLKSVFYISYLEVIFSVFLLLSLQSIALLLSLSNNSNSENYEIFFKISFILSIVNIPINLLSITVIVLALFSKMRDIIKPSVALDIINFNQKMIIGCIAAGVKVFEIIPFFIILYHKKKLFKGKGQINLPELPEGNVGLLSNDDENKIK